MSVGIVSIFFGLKLRWFRYRMKLSNDQDLSVTRRTSVEVHSFGRYSYIGSIDDDNLSGSSRTTSNNNMPPLSSSSSFSVKSKNGKYKIYNEFLSCRIFIHFFHYYHMHTLQYIFYFTSYLIGFLNHSVVF